MPLQTESSQTELEVQLKTDLLTLRNIVPGLDALEVRWNDARQVSGAHARGYFTPEEDDRVRQMVLAYRNYRMALHEVIFRCWQYPKVEIPELQLRMFLVGFATGLSLYSKSLKLIQSYERDPLVREKINEPDSKFELGEGFFDEVLAAYSSLGNYRGIITGSWFWLRHGREIRNALRTGDADVKWLVGVILRERKITRKRLAHVLLSRLRYDWRLFISTALKPVTKTQYKIQSLIGSAGAKLRTTSHYRPSLRPSVIAQLSGYLKPGDILLIRAEKKLTSAILPGFWAHAALYIGNSGALKSLGIANHPHVNRHLNALAAKDKGHGCVIEAISPEVQIVPLGRCLFADHVMVLRPVISEGDLSSALIEAFGHVGKPYDFEFDFNVSSRIVCTELIYRCYHHKGSIAFPLIKRLGRYTLSGDDIASLVINALTATPGQNPPPFDIVTIALGKADGGVQFVESRDALSALKKIQAGWRPASTPEPAHA